MRAVDVSVRKPFNFIFIFRVHTGNPYIHLVLCIYIKHHQEPAYIYGYMKNLRTFKLCSMYHALSYYRAHFPKCNKCLNVTISWICVGVM